MIRRTCIVVSLFVLAVLCCASSKPADKSSTIVDQGTFGVFQNGRRVATETFSIRQFPDSSITSSRIKAEAGEADGIDQSCELVLHPDATLSRYERKELAPVHSSATVEPDKEFLAMHTEADGKISDQPFFLTTSAFILDDYFFSTREVLLWRYLASSCKQRTGGDGCDLIRARFPVLIPQRHTSSEVFIEFKGYDDTPLNGRPQHLRHFLLQTEGTDWNLWLDPNQKLVRISVPSASLEVLRQEK
jgi:hypothetical protein